LIVYWDKVRFRWVVDDARECAAEVEQSELHPGCLLDGQQMLPVVNKTRFLAGKTKGDSSVPDGILR
jgi:hypothetical protein